VISSTIKGIINQNT